MRILFLSTWYPFPPDNGSKIRAYHLLRALAMGHEIALVSFSFGAAEPQATDRLHHLCTEVGVVPCNPFERSRMANALRFLSLTPVPAKALPEMTRAVTEVLFRRPFDVVIASTGVTAAYALLAPPAAVRVLEEHNSLTRWMGERYRAQKSAVQRLRCWVSWQKARLYEARLFRRFDLCTMVSEQDRTVSLELLPLYQGPIEVVSNGVDCGHNRPGLAQPVPGTLIYNGALTYSANYDAMRYFLKEVYPLIRREEPDVSLTITGSTSGVDLSGLRLDGSVRLSGYVDDVRPVVAGAWACVVPIRQGGGTRLKILEAMALGTPVVATCKGAEDLDVMPGQDILLADEPQEFAAQVVRLLRDSALRQQLAQHARHLVEERYDWQAIGQRFVRLVEAAALEKVGSDGS